MKAIEFEKHLNDIKTTKIYRGFMNRKTNQGFTLDFNGNNFVIISGIFIMMFDSMKVSSADDTLALLFTVDDDQCVKLKCKDLEMIA